MGLGWGDGHLPRWCARARGRNGQGWTGRGWTGRGVREGEKSGWEQEGGRELSEQWYLGPCSPVPGSLAGSSHPGLGPRFSSSTPLSQGCSWPWESPLLWVSSHSSLSGEPTPFLPDKGWGGRP